MHLEGFDGVCDRFQALNEQFRAERRLVGLRYLVAVLKVGLPAATKHASEERLVRAQGFLVLM